MNKLKKKTVYSLAQFVTRRWIRQKSPYHPPNSVTLYDKN